ncbi:transposase [Tenacibaculum finnmarkense]|uniref:transposase n=1 Tax=Tenacibaculum finnmarkense TaxID=2781243 RepID=UPI001F4D0741|nr:transposase [Tenacibaculum finnmarkense]
MNKRLTRWENKFNKLIEKTRFKVEHTFGDIKRWLNGGETRYIGMKKMHTQNLMEVLCYNLYRSPGVIYLIVKIKDKCPFKTGIFNLKSNLNEFLIKKIRTIVLILKRY